MSEALIATACMALTKEDDNAVHTRTALENIIGATVEQIASSNQSLDPKIALVVMDHLLDVGLKYRAGLNKGWGRITERYAQIPQFVTWAHSIWTHSVQGRTPVQFNQLDRLFKLAVGRYIGDETHAFLCAVLKDAMAQNEFFDAADFDTTNTSSLKLDVKERLMYLGLKSSTEHQQYQPYQHLYTQFVRHSLSSISWSDWPQMKGVCLFESSLDYLLNEKKLSVYQIVELVKMGYKTSLSDEYLSTRLTEHATKRNENLIRVLENRTQSDVIMDLFRSKDCELKFHNSVWSVAQIDWLHKSPSDQFTTKTMLDVWMNSPPSNRSHAITLGLLNKISAHDIKNKIKASITSNNNARMDEIVASCIVDAQALKDNPPKFAPQSAQTVLKKLENGALWYEMPQFSRRAVFNELSNHVTDVLNAPPDEKNPRITTTPQARTLGSHIHIMHRSLKDNDGLVDVDDAMLAKQILLRFPQINTKTQLLNMAKLVEKGCIEVTAEELDALQEMISDNHTQELLILSTATVRPQATNAIKRRL